ncbi:hypothetical protein H072_2582 [Dactylellina haptotyla CBS 200.50]|uniref:Purine nucleoside permease n=1 Tax=Dactylellina haptotyla (strain CBS 200.50) TaxID=1284197 RepID=S8AKF7_DACHA|nr:hypothetical protein H072_2582 [Dactylellina haptotyla CBS 200.50]
MRLLNIITGLVGFAGFASTTATQYGLPKHRSYRYGAGNAKRELQTTKQNRNFLPGRAGDVGEIIKPKVMIVAMFDLEANAFLNNNMPSLYGVNVTVPGFSPLYPQVHCTSAGDICHMTTGEGEINAAASVSALTYSRLFDLTNTYFLIGGVSGINPYFGTTGSVTFPRYAVQLTLQYEIDSRQLPNGGGGFSSGYFTLVSFGLEYDATWVNGLLNISSGSLGTKTFKNNVYPSVIYGTEVFELNDALRKRAFSVAKQAKLQDTDEAAAYRKKYQFSPAKDPPGVVMCDTGTADTWWTGSILADAFSNLTNLLTNGTGQYCTTQQEDNAILAVLVRAAAAELVDFARIVVMRTGSDFDRAPPGTDELYNLLQAPQGGFPSALANIYVAGVEVANDIVRNWQSAFENGIQPTNYIGDILNTLGSPNGYKPDIG